MLVRIQSRAVRRELNSRTAVTAERKPTNHAGLQTGEPYGMTDDTPRPSAGPKGMISADERR